MENERKQLLAVESTTIIKLLLPLLGLTEYLNFLIYYLENP